jgi:hypothetical protein
MMSQQKAVYRLLEQRPKHGIASGARGRFDAAATGDGDAPCQELDAELSGNAFTVTEPHVRLCLEPMMDMYRDRPWTAALGR